MTKTYLKKYNSACQIPTRTPELVCITVISHSPLSQSRLPKALLEVGFQLHISEVDSCEQEHGKSRGKPPRALLWTLQSCKPMALFGQQEWSQSLTQVQTTVSAKDWLFLAHFLLTWHSDFPVHTLLLSLCSEGTSLRHSAPPSLTVNAHFLPHFLWHQRQQTPIPFFCRGLTSGIWPDLEKESSVVKGAQPECFCDGESPVPAQPGCPRSLPRFPQPVLPSSAGRWLPCLLSRWNTHCPGPVRDATSTGEPRSRARGALLWTLAREDCAVSSLEAIPKPERTWPWTTCTALYCFSRGTGLDLKRPHPT